MAGDIAQAGGIGMISTISMKPSGVLRVRLGVAELPADMVDDAGWDRAAMVEYVSRFLTARVPAAR